MLQTTGQGPYREGAASIATGQGFFRPDSRPARDLGVLCCRMVVARHRFEGSPCRALDVMAGNGIRSVRYVLEGAMSEVWCNDADPERLPVLRGNLAGQLGQHQYHLGSLSAHRLLAGCIGNEQRFQVVDVDAHGGVSHLVAMAIQATAHGGLLYLTSTDGRGASGHDREAALRQHGAMARVGEASWELGLRLQLGTIARAAWTLGRGMEPVLAFADGRCFRTAVRLGSRAGAMELEQLGFWSQCPSCSEQHAAAALQAAAPGTCRNCGAAAAVNGPLWIGAMQCAAAIAPMQRWAEQLDMAVATRRLLTRLRDDPGVTPRCWSLGRLGRALRRDLPRRQALLAALHGRGFGAWASAIDPEHLRSTAPWPQLLETAGALLTTENHGPPNSTAR